MFGGRAGGGYVFDVIQRIYPDLVDYEEENDPPDYLWVSSPMRSYQVEADSGDVIPESILPETG